MCCNRVCRILQHVEIKVSKVRDFGQFNYEVVPRGWVLLVSVGEQGVDTSLPINMEPKKGVPQKEKPFINGGLLGSMLVWGVGYDV